MNISYFNDYIKELQSVPIEEITELSKRSALEILLNEIAKESDNSNKIQILHEPKRKENYGSPDFLVSSNNSILGYIENKKITENLDKVLKSEQIKKYRELSDNILLTNYIEFIWIKGESIFRETLCYLSDIENRKFRLDKDKAQKVEILILNFLSSIPQKIGNPKDLAFALAKRCRNLKEFLFDELTRQEREDQKGLLFDLYDTFKINVFNELSVTEFSDAFAQMLVYSIFLAKLNADTKIIELENVKKYIPTTFQLIKELVNFLDELEKYEYKETKWIIDETLSIINNLDLYEIRKQMSFNLRVKDKDDIETDPYIYFYENFLASYDKELRKAKGVYYTPQPIVNLIVRLINEVLKDEFNISNGLADNQRVTVLDFATGTSTFLVEIFKLILDTIPTDSKAKKDFIIKEHLLKNIYGFEYLIAPYTIAHLKLSQFLKENGYNFQENERMQIYLTNTLEPVEKQVKIAFLPQLSKETQSAQHIKDYPILVITGNPPYSGHSKNNGEWISNKIKDYFFFDGKPLGERNPKWLQDDYVKFIRFAQDKMDKVEEGIVGIITNHSFLDNPTFRGMRQSLMNTFDRIYFIDLHGNAKKKEKCPDGTKDENIFDIEQGVTISIFVKKPGMEKGIYHTDFWGTRKQKYVKSYESNLKNIDWDKLKPSYPFLIFKKQDEKQKGEYYKFWGMKDIFNIHGVGITTAHDDFVIDSDKDVLLKRFEDFKRTPREKSILHKKFNVKDKLGWDIYKGWDNLQNEKDINHLITTINYRIFDKRYIIYDDKLVWRAVKDIMLNFQEDNISLCTTRLLATNNWSHVFITNYIIDNCYISNLTKERTYSFPLYILKNGEEKQFFGVREPEISYESQRTKSGLYKSENFTPEFRRFVDSKYNLYKRYTPEEILGYIYAILHSPTYREKYGEFLKMDFPRIPFCEVSKQFEKISSLGVELYNKHLMKEEPKGTYYRNLGDFMGNSNYIVVKPEFRNNKLYINQIDYFDNVPEEVYNFYIGGYQVLDKYLKDRKGKDILKESVTIEKIIKVLAYTIKQMELIDKETK